MILERAVFVIYRLLDKENNMDRMRDKKVCVELESYTTTQQLTDIHKSSSLTECFSACIPVSSIFFCVCAPCFFIISFVPTFFPFLTLHENHEQPLISVVRLNFILFVVESKMSIFDSFDLFPLPSFSFSARTFFDCRFDNAQPRFLEVGIVTLRRRDRHKTNQSRRRPTPGLYVRP